MTLRGSSSEILRRILDALLIGLILVVLAGVVLGRVVPLTGRQTLIVGGGSMEPSIPLGAVVVTEPVAATDLQIGDVVSLRSGPELRTIFTHRVTRVITRTDGPWLETKGDANARIDPSIAPASQVIGRVMLSVPFGGYLLKLLSIPSGLLLVVLIAGVLLTLTWLLESFEKERQQGGRTVAAAASMGARSPATRARRARWEALVRGRGSGSTQSSSGSAAMAADRHLD